MKVQVSMSVDFLSAFAKIPRKEQKRVREFIEKFFANPRSSGIDYEKIHEVKDKNVRTVRISKQYRAVVLHPEKENVYVLVWVDNHDEAINWAKNKHFTINPYSGALQVIDYEAINSWEENLPKEEEKTEYLFSNIPEETLLRYGIPRFILPQVRKIRSEEELDSFQQYLPGEAWEALCMFASGYSLDEMERELEIIPTETVGTTGFQEALENMDSQRRFHSIEDANELSEILNAPLEAWRVFLHPSQRRLVENQAKGSIRVLGGAGTGKTVVAMHRAKHLANKVFTTPEDRILFLTFSRNLAIDIEQNLRKICPKKTMSRIEVVNIDAWVCDFLKNQGFSYKILFDQQKRDRYWENAINGVAEGAQFEKIFYEDEWEQVIQANGISNLMEYLSVSRVGRGKSISRAIRKKVWGVFEEYRNQLNRDQYKEMMDLVREARLFLKEQGDILPYRSIIVDEGQDMGKEVYLLLRAIVPEGPNDIFIVGDGHQAIYKKRVVLSQCQINIRGKRSRKLRLNYRTTEEIRRWAINFLEGQDVNDLDGGTDNQRGYRSIMHGAKPILKHFSLFSEEIDFVDSYIQKLLESKEVLEGICLICRTNKALEKYKKELKKRGHSVFSISRKGSDDHKQKGIRLSTMYRVKGLEFNYIIICSANKDTIPINYILAEDDNLTAKEEAEFRERALFYVAATRAKKEVLVTSYGDRSPFLESSTRK